MAVAAAARTRWQQQLAASSSSWQQQQQQQQQHAARSGTRHSAHSTQHTAHTHICTRTHAQASCTGRIAHAALSAGVLNRHACGKCVQTRQRQEHSTVRKSRLARGQSTHGSTHGSPSSHDNASETANTQHTYKSRLQPRMRQCVHADCTQRNERKWMHAGGRQHASKRATSGQRTYKNTLRPLHT